MKIRQESEENNPKTGKIYRKEYHSLGRCIQPILLDNNKQFEDLKIQKLSGKFGNPENPGKSGRKINHI